MEDSNGLCFIEIEKDSLALRNFSEDHFSMWADQQFKQIIVSRCTNEDFITLIDYADTGATWFVAESRFAEELIAYAERVKNPIFVCHTKTAHQLDDGARIFNKPVLQSN